MLLAQRKAQLDRLKGDPQAERELNELAKKAGVKIKVTRPNVNMDKIKQEWELQDEKERARRLQKAVEQQMEDEKKLANKIKMAKVRAARKKK